MALRLIGEYLKMRKHGGDRNTKSLERGRINHSKETPRVEKPTKRFKSWAACADGSIHVAESQRWYGVIKALKIRATL